jgi:gluconolactonase
MSQLAPFAIAMLVLSACGGDADDGAGVNGDEPGASGERAGGGGGHAQGGHPAASGGAPGAGGSIATDAGGAGGEPIPVDAGGATDTAPEPADANAPDTATTRPMRCPAGPFEAPKAGASHAVCGGFPFKYNWNEGPTWVARANAFFFSNFVEGGGGPGDMIKFTPATGQCETFIEGNTCNGLAVTPDGNIVAACQGARAIVKYDVVTRQPTMLATMAEGKMLDSPNDIVVHSNGTIYFTNPPNDLGGRPVGLGSALMRIDPAGAISVIARAKLNGLALSPDERTLYVVFQGIWELDESGAPVKKGGGFPLGNDGLGVDCAGNVYNQSGTIVNAQGQSVGKFPGGTNMAFGGPEGKTLLVVNAKSAHTVEMSVPGLP